MSLLHNFARRDLLHGQCSHGKLSLVCYVYVQLSYQIEFKFNVSKIDILEVVVSDISFFPAVKTETVFPRFLS